MTLQELQQTADGLQASDQQLAGLPASGRVAQEIKAVREHLGDVIKFVAAALRHAQGEAQAQQEHQTLVADLAGDGAGSADQLQGKSLGELRNIRTDLTARKAKEQAEAEQA